MAGGHPVVFAGMGEKGPTVSVDNEAGIWDAMRHLVNHGHQRIVFMRGGDTGDALLRLKAFQEAALAHGLSCGDLVIRAIAQEHVFSGITALVKAKTEFSAVLCHSDELVPEAIRALRHHGFNIPGDVAVVGFDDRPLARFTTPPLTTVRFPMFEMGCQSVETLLEIIAGRKPSQETVLIPPRLIVRQSCGYYHDEDESGGDRLSSAEAQGADRVEEELVQAMAALLLAEAWPMHDGETTGLCRELLDLLKQAVAEDCPPVFMDRFIKTLLDLEETPYRPLAWHKVMAVITGHGGRLEKAWDLPGLAPRLAGLIAKSTSAIGESIERMGLRRADGLITMSDRLGMLSVQLLSAKDDREILAGLSTVLPTLGIGRVDTVFYEAEGDDPVAWSVLQNAGGKEAARFPTRQFPPPGLHSVDEPLQLAVLPLILQDRLLGYLALDAANLAPDATIIRDLAQNLQRKRNEDLLARQAAELDHINRELSRSNTELEQFAYVASHDLQEPLRMVQSYMQLIQQRYRDKLDADAGEFFDFAIDGATRMRSLINDLLTYSRVGTRGKPFEPTDCNIALQKTLDNLKLAIEENHAVVTREALPEVTGDGGQLIQLFQNLIGNAIKFHGERTPQIGVTVGERGGQWVFAVRDNGIGIAPEYFDKIFKIFQRLHTRSEYPGTGIGLAVCKKIVERHGGQIWVESKAGEGTTFYFAMPKAGESAGENMPKE
jgi:signal transduction histidine kinase